MHLIVWTVSGQRYAIETRSIVEVVPAVTARSIPGTPHWVPGLMEYRGALIPLVDVRRLLELGATPLRRACRVLVTRTDDGPLGLLVESVESLERSTEDPAHPGLASPEMPFLGRLVGTSLGVVQLVRPDELLSDEHRAVLFDNAAGGDG